MAQNKVMEIETDNKLNPQLKREVQTLRGMINTGVNSERFKKDACKDKPGYIVTDTQTGKQVMVPLFALSDVMNVLNALFE